MNPMSPKSRLLLVDNDPEDIWMLVEHLEADYEVLCATSGPEGLRIAFSEDPPDLILLDIMMPGLDGYEICRQLKADKQARDIPVIFVSAKTKASEEVKGLELGAQDYITKPFSIPVVRARINSVLNLKKELDRRLILKTRLEELNRQQVDQIEFKLRELRETRETLEVYEQNYNFLLQKNLVDKAIKTILVVDDHPENIHVLVDNLEGQYEVLCATSGKDALEIAFSEHPPDLILLDIMMPGMDGFEVCSRLKARVDTRDIPVIFVTACGEEMDETKGLDIGAADFITKPFSIPVVKVRIKATLRLKEEMDNRIALTRKLEDLNRNLEHRVKEKTHALERAHADVKASELKYRMIYENAVEGIFQSTPDGCLLDANPALAEILGYESADELISTVTDIMQQIYYRPADRSLFNRIIGRDGEISGLETQVKKKNHQIIWALISAKAIRDDTDDHIYYQGFLTDITEHKHAREALQTAHDELETRVATRTAELVAAKEEADAANRAKSDFLARMSHEIRTPIAAVTGLTHVILKTRLTTDQRDYLNKIQIASGKLIDVINDILDFSKVEAGRLELETCNFSLNELLEQLIDMFSERVGQKDLALVSSVDPEVPRQLRGDPGRLAQILSNLIDNAEKFTDEGEITVAVTVDHTTPVMPNQVRVKFCIHDTGIGISPDIIPILFEAFTQANTAAQHSHKGTGLGLAICERLVHLMGGTIWADSEPGQGSTYTFTVVLEKQAVEKPLTTTTSSATEPTNGTDEKLAMLNGRRILLVEDHPFNQDVAIALLGNAGLIVDIANDGQAAVEKITSREKHYDAILMDIQMPVMDGYEATRKIREWEAEQLDWNNPGSLPMAPRQKIPIVALTAHALKGDTNKCLAAGMDDYISKPFEERQLLQVLLKQIAIKTDPSMGSLESKPLDPPSQAQAAQGVQLDITGSLARMGGRKYLYVKMLGRFTPEFGESAETITECLKSGDMETARRLAHSIKSAAGNIGATALFEASCNLEKSIAQNKETSDDCLMHFKHILNDTHTEIAKYLASESSQP